jgi:hypothetical protein
MEEPYQRRVRLDISPALADKNNREDDLMTLDSSGAGMCLVAVQKFCRIVLELFRPTSRLVFTEKMAHG